MDSSNSNQRADEGMPDVWHNTEHAIEFLKAMHPDTLWGLTAISPWSRSA